MLLRSPTALNFGWLRGFRELSLLTTGAPVAGLHTPTTASATDTDTATTTTITATTDTRHGED